ncbi:Unknown protein sequence [Pseudomonas coronafaciens pv. atropurpurea]|nr:Unknown protein sequence [Pseudomonas coronafaciens pv. atropurpurea]
MAGSPRHELDQSTDHRADSAAAADGRIDALAGRKASAAQGTHQSVFQHARAGHLGGAVFLGATDRQQRFHRRLPAGQLGRSLRHSAGSRSPVGLDAGTDRHRRRLRPAVRAGTLGPGRCQLSCTVPDSANGPIRRIPDSRPVQSVRVFRGAARSLLWPDAARLRSGESVHRPALYFDQPAGLVAIPDRCRADLRGNRYAQLRRPCDQDSAGIGSRSGTAARRRRHSGHGLSRQGGHVATELLAGPGLLCRQRAGSGDVCDHDKSRHLHPAATMDAAVFRPGGRICILWWRVADIRRHGDDFHRSHCDHCSPAPGAARQPEHSGIGRHTFVGHRFCAAKPDIGRTVLSGQLDPGAERDVFAGRTDRTFSFGQRDPAGR